MMLFEKKNISNLVIGILVERKIMLSPMVMKHFPIQSDCSYKMK